MSDQDLSLPIEKKKTLAEVLSNQNGRIGYIIAWLCGVPASVLFVIFLLRGH